MLKPLEPSSGRKNQALRWSFWFRGGFFLNQKFGEVRKATLHYTSLWLHALESARQDLAPFSACISAPRGRASRWHRCPRPCRRRAVDRPFRTPLRYVVFSERRAWTGGPIGLGGSELGTADSVAEFGRNGVGVRTAMWWMAPHKHLLNLRVWGYSGLRVDGTITKR